MSPKNGDSNALSTIQEESIHKFSGLRKEEENGIISSRSIPESFRSEKS